jgi:hypothetical protein
MVNFTEVPHDTDGWELFARDYFVESGFFIESPPDRGPDQGKDILISEQLTGRVGNYRMRWLVSCKHLAASKRAVSEKDEPNIRERLESFEADGFIGFYSTLASSGLNSRLGALRRARKIKDYSVIDHRVIENALVTVGYSHLMMRYFPKSYQTVKPLHLVTPRYESLPCLVCGKDLLLSLFKTKRPGILVRASRDVDGKELIEDVWCVCKKCDGRADSAARRRGLDTAWSDLADLVIPIEFLRYMFATMNRLRAGNDTYTDEAYKKEIGILARVAQKVLRHTTDRERERYMQLLALPG